MIKLHSILYTDHYYELWETIILIAMVDEVQTISETSKNGYFTIVISECDYGVTERECIETVNVISKMHSNLDSIGLQ